VKDGVFWSDIGIRSFNITLAPYFTGKLSEDFFGIAAAYGHM
jgi:hypothetical protein